MNELISIIVPVYNASEYLNACLVSLARQTDLDFEVILVDDGSTDDSYDICEDFCNQFCNFRVISKPNGGVSSARNLGIKESTGKYLCFVDSDDYVTPEYIRDLRVEMSDDIDFVLSKFHFINGDKITTPTSCHKVGSIDILFDDDTIIACQAPYGKLFKTEIIKSNLLLFDECVRYGEDRLFVYSYLMCANRVAISPGVNYYYIRRPGSLVSKIYPVDTECYAYLENKKIITSLIREKHIVDKRKLRNLYAEVCDFGNRILNSIYHTEGLSRKERISVLHSRMDMNFHSKYLRADSFKEQLIRALLRCRLYSLYDMLRYAKQNIK